MTDLKRLEDYICSPRLLELRVLEQRDAYQTIGRMIEKRLERWMQPETPIESRLGGMAVAMGQRIALEDLAREVEVKLRAIESKYLAGLPPTLP